MAKEEKRPRTMVKKPEPMAGSVDWIIWAAWADRITFEEIQEKTGLNEAGVIKTMRQNLKPASFRRWRKRASKQSIKHRAKFEKSQRRARGTVDEFED
jgi:uncharacterized protein (TIGR03643 family)